MNNLTEGLTNLRAASKVLSRDFRVAYEDGDWNIAVKRAHESIEFAVKAAFYIVGKNPPEEHNLKVPDSVIKTLPLVAFHLEDDPQSDTVLLWRNVKNTAYRLLRVERGVATTLGSCAGIFSQIQTRSPDSPEPFELVVEGTTVRVLQGDGRSLLVNTLSSAKEGQWKQIPISRDQKKLIDNYVRKLYTQRNEVFYFERLCSQSDADRAREQAWQVLRIVLESLGMAMPDENTAAAQSAHF